MTRAGSSSPKSSAGVRKVPVAAALRELLLTWKMACGWSANEDGYVFGSLILAALHGDGGQAQGVDGLAAGDREGRRGSRGAGAEAEPPEPDRPPRVPGTRRPRRSSRQR